MTEMLIELLEKMISNFDEDEGLVDLLRQVSEACDKVQNCKNGKQNLISEQDFIRVALYASNALQACVLYKSFMQHPIVSAFDEIKELNIEEVHKVNDLARNAQSIENAINEFLYLSEMAEKLGDAKSKKERLKYRKLAIVSKQYVSTLKELFTKAAKVEKLSKDRRLPFETYSKLVRPLNLDIISLIDSTVKTLSQVREFEISDTFKNVIRDSKAFIMSINTLIKQYGEKDKQVRIKAGEEMAKQMQERKVAPIENLAEKERMYYINKANAMYEEFKLDFLRDLQKQYAFSTKRMYSDFITGKVGNFEKRFNMPLDRSTSLGKAKEACSQIQNLINYVSIISENSYNVVAYSGLE